MLNVRQELRSVKASNQALEERLQELNRDIEERDTTIKELQELRLEDGESKQAPTKNTGAFVNEEDYIKLAEFNQMEALAASRLLENEELQK